MASSEDGFDDSPEGSIEDSIKDSDTEDSEGNIERSVSRDSGGNPGHSIEGSPVESIPEGNVDDLGSQSQEAIEDSNDDQEQYGSEQDHDSIAEAQDGSVIEDSEGSLQDSNEEVEGTDSGSQDVTENLSNDDVHSDRDNNNHDHDHDSIDDLDLDIADGISSSSIPDDIDLEEVFLRAAGEDSPIPEWVLNDTRGQAMRLTRRGEASASQSQPESSQPTQEQGNSQSFTSQRTPSKRNRSPDSEVIPGSYYAAGPSSSVLPPISSLLESIGGSSSSSSIQVNQQRPQISPKRLRREDPIVIDDIFGSDDEGVEVVNLVDVDRPRAAQDEPETQLKVEPAPEPEVEPKPEPASLVRLSGLQCVICMDEMTNLTVTHCGHLFCGECLHSSLTMSYDRRICPICRTKLELRVDGMSAAKHSRSYFPLVVKTRSTNRQGKQPVRR